MSNRILHYDILEVTKENSGQKTHKCKCRLCGSIFYATSYQLNGITHCGCAGNRGCLNEFEIIDDSYAKMWTKDLSTYTLVDVEDIPLLKSFNRTWGINAEGYWCISRPHKMLHRVVMKAPRNFLVDHIFHNKNDNRKSKLRVCSHSENTMNMKPKQDRELPKGVRLRHNGKFNAYIKKGNVRKTKDFPTLEEALHQRKQWEDELFGDFKFKEGYI